MPPVFYFLLFGWLKKIAGLGNIFMGNLIDKDQNSLGRLIGFLADHLGNAFADFLFLLLAEAPCNPDIYIRHNNSLNEWGVRHRFNQTISRVNDSAQNVLIFILEKKGIIVPAA